MARQKKYDLDSVLSSATELFLKKGYEATSLRELVAHTGLNRHSLYKQFVDKESFFLACVKHYTLEERNLKTVEILTQNPLGIKNIEEFLEDRINYALSDNCYGCLLVNSVSERETLSGKINDKINKIISNQEKLIYECLEASVQSGEISISNDVRALTDFFSCVFRGLMNRAKEERDKTSLKKMKHMALSAVVK